MITIEQLKDKIIPVLDKNGVLSAGIFGSYARGEADEKSDIDILVELRRPFGLIRFIQLKQELEQATEKKIDLVTPNSLNRFIEPQAMKDLKYIYGHRR